MQNIIKTIGSFLTLVVPIFGLYQAKVINQETAIMIGIIGTVFILCYSDQKFSTEKNLNPIRNALAEIQKWLTEEWKFVPLHEIKPTGYIKSQSPIDLTILGRNLLNESGAKKFIDENWQEFEQLINQGDNKTAYDVQDSVSRIIGKRENDPEMDQLKNFAYHNPQFHGNTLIFSDIQKVMVIYLRNLYLERHPEITS